MRKTLNLFKFQSNLAIRGPKKKADASSEMNKDYINIFKDKPDIVLNFL
jgi:hypothetical protein